MRTETINVYTFQELPTESAKERARERGRQWMSEDPAWCDESRQSIQAFCDHFGAQLVDWSIGAFSPLDYNVHFNNGHFRGVKLRDIDRDAMPTGYCLDCTLWQTMHDEFKRTGNAMAAFEVALHAGFKAWRDDLESQLEDEYIEDFLTANEYEFDEDGYLH